YGVLLDMSSAKGAQFRMEGMSNQFAPSVVQHIWSTANNLGYGNYFINQNANSIIDDHYYVNTMNGTPSIDIIWLDPSTKNGFAPHWHTLNDNMSIIDKATMKAVGQTLLQVIYNESPNF
ncbi:MAG: M28 family peptidase, partial [Pseudomonadota bacterium]